MLIEMLAAAAVFSGAGQEFAPQVPGGPERGAPRGDYRDSRSGEYVNRGRLYADCRNNRGNIRETSIELNRCTSHEIRNNDGLLVCGPFAETMRIAVAVAVVRIVPAAAGAAGGLR